MTNNQRRGCFGRCPAPIRTNPLDKDADIPQAMAYVKNGGFGRIFEPMKALSVGTVFPNDAEALDAKERYADAAAKLRRRYEDKYGPPTAQASGGGNCWEWITDPWPWECV